MYLLLPTSYFLPLTSYLLLAAWLLTVIIEDYKLLDAAKPLRALVEGLDLADYLTEELVHLFEARCAQLAAAACWVPAPEE